MSILDGWRFCPRCAAELADAGDHLHCPGCGYDAWPGAVPGTQALLVQDGRVMLGRRAIEPGRGKWDIPGGFLGEDEHPLDGLKREFLEETGLEIEPTAFLGFWIEDYLDGRKILCLTWLARRVGGEERLDELDELRWFAPGELPAQEEYAFPTFAEILSVWREQHA